MQNGEERKLHAPSDPAPGFQRAEALWRGAGAEPRLSPGRVVLLQRGRPEKLNAYARMIGGLWRSAVL